MLVPIILMPFLETSIGKVLLCLLLTAVLAGSAMLFKEQGVTAIVSFQSS